MWFRPPLIICFVLYYDFSTASAVHVHNFANALSRRGHECTVAVPLHRDSVHEYMTGATKYAVHEFGEILNGNIYGADNEPDIIHAWTPRELVRTFSLELQSRFPACRLIVHLEDNEEIIVETYTGRPYDQLLRLSAEVLQEEIPDVLSRPGKYEQFLKNADGVTVITEQLLDFVPSAKPWHRLWPVIDLHRFRPGVNGSGVRRKLGIAANEFVLCYIGSVHAVNAAEVRELYRAVARVNREGLSVRLIRTGRDTVDFLGGERDVLLRHVHSLGFVDMDEIPGLMAAADLLVQPGAADRFNRYRLPSKIPEFLAAGRPVVVPAANIGLHLKDGRQAVLLKTGDSKEIAAVIHRLHNRSSLRKKLAGGGRNFAKRNFSEKKIIKPLVSFYRSLMAVH